MLYENVCIEGLGYVIPDQVVTSAWIEEQLAPVYQALNVPSGRLEQLTGIRERRWWPEGARVSDGAAQAGERAIADASIDRERIQCLINASVVRDYVEPATAVLVHHQLGLSPTAMNWDVSNACLGFLNGMVTIAGMIELGHIEAGIVVSAENIRPGQVRTIESMLSMLPGTPLAEINMAFRDNLATFTLGCGAVAMVLRHRSTSKTGLRLLGGSAYAHTQHNQLCVAGEDWMRTDSSNLLKEGMKVIALNWERFKRELRWDSQSIDRLFTHQVSEKQRQIGLQTLGLTEDIDFPTLSYLGNIASVSAPICMAIGKEKGFLTQGDRVCMLGVGSGVNSIILGIQ
jgi:3-oxoacyl-[acyl-carrier-protein] synthase III